MFGNKNNSLHLYRQWPTKTNNPAHWLSLALHFSWQRLFILASSNCLSSFVPSFIVFLYLKKIMFIIPISCVSFKNFWGKKNQARNRNKLFAFPMRKVRFSRGERVSDLFRGMCLFVCLYCPGSPSFRIKLIFFFL